MKRSSGTSGSSYDVSLYDRGLCGNIRAVLGSTLLQAACCMSGNQHKEIILQEPEQRSVPIVSQLFPKVGSQAASE
eukprot:1945195-Amphidinium_carterae.1